jgi:hypothetical protein
LLFHFLSIGIFLPVSLRMSGWYLHPHPLNIAAP